MFNGVSKDIARLETKLDQAIAAVAADRAITSAHIAACNVRNEKVDADETRARQEWEDFRDESRRDRQKLADSVKGVQIRLAGLITGVAVLAWLVDHFHLFH